MDNEREGGHDVEGGKEDEIVRENTESERITRTSVATLKWKENV